MSAVGGAGSGLSFQARTPQPWNEGTYPTATQLGGWLGACTDWERLEVARRMLAEPIDNWLWLDLRDAASPIFDQVVADFAAEQAAHPLLTLTVDVTS